MIKFWLAREAARAISFAFFLVGLLILLGVVTVLEAVRGWIKRRRP